MKQTDIYEEETIMRILAAVLLIGLASQVGAVDKKYDEKACNDISEVIDFLLSLTPQMWKDLEHDPEDKEKALEISWAVDLAASYTTIYQPFCPSKD